MKRALVTTLCLAALTPPSPAITAAPASPETTTGLASTPLPDDTTLGQSPTRRFP